MTDQAPGTGELTYTRVFDAPRELVFRCMLEPEHLTHFWGPAGVSTPLETIKVDARPGGVFETVMVNDSDGSRYPTRAVYVEITEPERIIWTEPDSSRPWLPNSPAWPACSRPSPMPSGTPRRCARAGGSAKSSRT